MAPGMMSVRRRLFRNAWWVAPAVLGLTTPLLTACQAGTPEGTQAVTIDGRRFVLELAADRESRTEGLSDRESIPDEGGMLFVFPDVAERSFWMYHCLVPIDILYLSPTGRVISMYQMEVEPYDTPEEELKRYPSRWPAQFAIELKGGTLDDLEVEVGDRIDLPLEDLKRLAE